MADDVLTKYIYDNMDKEYPPFIQVYNSLVRGRTFGVKPSKFKWTVDEKQTVCEKIVKKDISKVTITMDSNIFVRAKKSPRVSVMDKMAIIGNRHFQQKTFPLN